MRRQRAQVLGPGSLTRLICSFLCSLFLFSSNVMAHNHSGPPVQIVTDERLGGWIVSAWIQPHVGTVKVFVHISPANGEPLPDDLKIEVGVRSDSAGSHEVLGPAECDRCETGQYQADLSFDASQSSQLKIYVKSHRGSYDIVRYVGSSPSGPAAWQMPLYLLPFLAVGGLWFRVNRLRQAMKRGRPVLAQ